MAVGNNRQLDGQQGGFVPFVYSLAHISRRLHVPPLVDEYNPYITNEQLRRTTINCQQYSEGIIFACCAHL